MCFFPALCPDQNGIANELNSNVTACHCLIGDWASDEIYNPRDLSAKQSQLKRNKNPKASLITEVYTEYK